MIEKFTNIEEMKKYFKNKPFVVCRLPPKTRYEIVKFAEEECCDDYGMAVKTLWEYYKTRNKYDEIMFAINDLHERVKRLEKGDASQESEYKEIVMNDGTVRRGGKKDE